MSTRKHSPRTRAFRPAADDLERRQVLSGVVSGTDIDGDVWTLRLIGPGALSVVKQAGSDGNPAALNSLTEINTITVGGTDPLSTRLVGSVVKAANGDGRVFFQEMGQLPTRSNQFPTAGLGLLAVDTPDFWLGNTTQVVPTTGLTAPTIALPDGTNTLRFGGVDTTHNRPTPTATTTSDVAAVALGLPPFGGTRIIIDRSVSSTEQAPAAAPTPSEPNPQPRTVQHGVAFAVSGRLSLFQANAVEGDAANPPGQFRNQNPNASGTGGTLVISGTVAEPPVGDPLLAAVPGIKGAVTGQIGDLRVGGDATNLTAIVYDATGSGSARVSNFSIGGETNNVLLTAPDGSRNVVFGKGMDTVEIRSHVIHTLKANRGALNSTVVADREIAQVDLGGDVVNTQILAGYVQSFSNIYTTVRGISTNALFSSQPAPPPLPQNAQPFGSLSVHVAGDVTDSVFAASVQPVNNVFGDPNQLVLTGGHIRGKIEGRVDNLLATPNTPTHAFFAQKVDALSGPVVPPNVPEAPFSGPPQPSQLPGIHHLGRAQGLTRATTGQSSIRQAAAQTHGTHSATTLGESTPKGPRPSLTTRGR